jgi:hypothetical protein
VIDTRVGVTSAASLARRSGGTGALLGWQKAAWILMTAAHTRAGSDQLAVGGDRHAALRWVARESGPGGQEPIRHQAHSEAVGALNQPRRVCIGQRHAEGRLPWEVIRPEPQVQTVPSSPLLRTQFGQQLGPRPSPPAGQEEAQTQADRVEGGRTEVTAEPLAEDWSPGTKVEQAQDQVKVVEPGQVVDRADVVGGPPDVVGATAARPPGWNVGRNHQLQGQ